MQRQRIRYIDALRGFTMLLVIYSHLTILDGYYLTTLNHFFIRFRMPLFFFISGFFLYSDNYNTALFKRRLKNRISKQFIPTLLLCALFSVCFSLPLGELPFDEYKRGYWFTYVAVEMFLIMAPILYIADLTKTSGRTKTTILVFLLIAALAIYLIDAEWLHLYKTETGGLLSLKLLLKYLPYLILGMILKATSGRCLKYIVRPVTIIMGIILFFTLAEWDDAATPTLSRVIMIFCPIFAIIALIGIFHRIYNSRLFINGKIKVLETIGSSTLEIYLLHYFLIRHLTSTDSEAYHTIIQLFIQVKDTVWEFPVFLTASFVLAGLCIIAKHILQYIGIYDYIFNPLDKITAHKRLPNNDKRRFRIGTTIRGKVSRRKSAS